MAKRAGSPLILLVLLSSALAQEPRLVPMKRDSPPAAVAPGWTTSFAEARLRGRAEKKPLLLYFTAKW